MFIKSYAEMSNAAVNNYLTNTQIIPIKDYPIHLNIPAQSESPSLPQQHEYNQNLSSVPTTPTLFLSNKFLLEGWLSTLALRLGF